jgi:hypothetical protein
MISSATAKFSALSPHRPKRSALSAAGMISTLPVLACLAYAFAGGWSAPVSLSTPIPPTFYTTAPSVAINSSGAQAAAWINEGNDLLLQVAARDAGGNWNKAQTLTPLNGDNAADPDVAVGPAGNAVAVWDLYQINPPNALLVQASTRPAHGSWGPVVTLSSTTSSSSLPKVGTDASGNAIAIWLQTTSSSSAIVSATLPSGGSWSTPLAISTPGVSAANPCLAINANDDAVAGWQTSNGQILVAERKAGTWGAPITIAKPAFRQGSPRVALNNVGDAAIAWSGRGTTLVATRAAGGNWTTPTTVSKQSEGATARIALDDAGNAVALFALVKYTGGGYVYPMQVVSRPAGGSWSTPVTISGASDYSTAVHLVATPAGTFIAGWVDDTTFTVRAAVRPAGQINFGAPANIDSGSQLDLVAAPGFTAATWIGSGPAVRVSTNSTP